MYILKISFCRVSLFSINKQRQITHAQNSGMLKFSLKEDQEVSNFY